MNLWERTWRKICHVCWMKGSQGIGKAGKNGSVMESHVLDF